MSVFLFGHRKGGVAKTTNAVNFAVWLAHEGCDVILVDADSQQSAKSWADRRDESIAGGMSIPPVLTTSGKGNLLTLINDLSRRYQHVVVDAGGRDTVELRSGMLAADVFVMPTRASQLDLEGTDYINNLVIETRALKPSFLAYGMITMAPTNPMNHERKEALEFLERMPELEVFPVFISERKVFRDAMLDGRGVVEMSNSQAKAEVQLMGQELLSLVTP